MIASCIGPLASKEGPMVRKGRVLICWQFVLLMAGGLSFSPRAHGAGLTITPASITNEYSGTITLNITGLPNGQTVLVEKFADVNGNGAIDSNDLLTQSLRLTDGQALTIGGVRDSNVPGDEDGAANGQIRTVLDFQTLSETNRAIGTFIYQVSSPSGGFAPVTAVFTVLQPDYPQHVTGRVTSGAAGVPGALVVLLVDREDGNFFSGVAANAGGNFVLNAPTGTYRLIAIKHGFLFDFQSAASVTLRPGATVTQNLSLIAADRTISGQLTDAATAVGIPGVQLFTESNAELVTLTFTDAAGNFALPVSSAATQWRLDTSQQDAALRGYLPLPGDGVEVDTGGGNVADVSIQWLKATALIYGRLADAQGNALPGIRMRAETNESRYRGVGITDMSGNFVIGVTAGMWNVEPRDDLASYLVQGTKVTVAFGQAVRADLVAQSCNAHLRGRVLDEGGAGVGDLNVVACPQGQGFGPCPSMNSGSDGSFDICVLGGTWSVFTETSSLAEHMLVGTVVSVTVPGGGQQNDIILLVRHANWSISGSVRDRDTGTPLVDVQVQASASIYGTD